MKVLVNALRKLRGGNATYVRKLVAGLGARDDVDLVVIVDQESQDEWRSIAPRARCVAVRTWPHPLGLVSERVRLKQELSRQVPDVFHSPATLLPLWRPSCATVVTVHDLNFCEFTQGWAKDFYKKRIYAYSVKHADGIIAVSSFTARQLRKYFPEGANKAQIIWEGQDYSLQQKGCRRRADGRKGRYIVSFGHWRHKNAQAAIHVLRKVLYSGRDLNLLVLGEGRYIERTLKPLASSMGVSEHVEFLGHVSDGRLKELYTGASALVFMSMFEGFGLPAIEAMATGCPAVVSDRGALPEITGGYACVVGVSEYEEAADYIKALLDSDEYRESEGQKVRKYASQLTWSKAIGETVDLYIRMTQQLRVNNHFGG